MCHIYLTKEDLLGKHNWKGNLNLVNIVMIGLTNALPESHNEYGLHRLLCAMFSNELSQQQKMKIMEQEYHIPMEESFKEEVSIMCNLSQANKPNANAKDRSARSTRVAWSLPDTFSQLLIRPSYFGQPCMPSPEAMTVTCAGP